MRDEQEEREGVWEISFSVGGGGCLDREGGGQGLGGCKGKEAGFTRGGNGEGVGEKGGCERRAKREGYAEERGGSEMSYKEGGDEWVVSRGGVAL